MAKRYLGPGWRMGWVILYASQALRGYYRPLIKGIFNVILMPNTVVQAAIPQILKNSNNDARMDDCMNLMKQNQLTLK
jgi:tyrosine aminotransferase